MIRFHKVTRAIVPMVGGVALALALLAGVARPAPADADPPPQDPPHAGGSPSGALFPPGPTAVPPVDCGVIVHDANLSPCF